MSGLCINVSKSTLFAAGNRKEALELEANSQGLPDNKLLMRYLGLPLTTKTMTKEDYKPLVNKIRTCLMSWTCRHLSYAGRQSVITSISNLWCSVFRLPCRYFEDIESLCEKFLWSGSPIGNNRAKIAWEELCIPKVEGWQGIRRLKVVSQVFALNLIWKLFTLSCSLWVAWIRAHLLRDGSFRDAHDKGKGSWIWRKLLKLKPVASDFIHMEVNNGANTYFWTDH